MSDRYDSTILMVAGIIFVLIVLIGNRDVWRSGRRSMNTGFQAKARLTMDWPIALAALTIVFLCCALALHS